MKVTCLNGSGKIYTCNTYLVTGDWKRLEDLNTLIDPGSDPEILESIKDVQCGVGKRKIEQVVLTHNHFDHCRNMDLILREYNPVVYAYSAFAEGVDVITRNGDKVPMGDRTFDVIHAPGHTEDSICLYQEDEGVLFSGDAPILDVAADGSHDPRFIRVLEGLARKHIRTIYPGHGPSVVEDVYAKIKESVMLLRGQGVKNHQNP